MWGHDTQEDKNAGTQRSTAHKIFYPNKTHRYGGQTYILDLLLTIEIDHSEMIMGNTIRTTYDERHDITHNRGITNNRGITK